MVHGANLLIIKDGKKWHYLTITNPPALLINSKWKHNRDLYRLTCLRSFRTKEKADFLA